MWFLTSLAIDWCIEHNEYWNVIDRTSWKMVSEFNQMKTNWSMIELILLLDRVRIVDRSETVYNLH